MLTLYLHDEAGHTRMTYIRLITDDTLADEFRPIASAIMVDDEATSEYVTLDGTKTVAEVEWPIYRARLSDTGDLSVSFDASESYDPDAPEGEKGIELYEWKVFFDYPWDTSEPTLEGHIFQIPAAAGGEEWSYVFRNLTASPDGNLENEIRIELIVYDKAGKTSLKHRMYFVVVGEDFGDEEPIVQFTKPGPNDNQNADLVTISGTMISGAENSDVIIEVALTDDVLDYTPTQKITQKTIGKYNKTESLADGQQFTLTLNISDLYQETGVAATIYVKIKEGDGERYTLYQEIGITLVPRLPEVVTPDGGDSMGTLLLGGIGVFVLLLVVVATMMIRGRGGKDSDEDTVEQFGGVEDMDPVEAYVQQMVASGYDEQTARTYAKQYYAQYYEQQRKGGG
jgi:hypothetical protein